MHVDVNEYRPEGVRLVSMRLRLWDYDPKLEPYIVKGEGKLAGQSPSVWVFRKFAVLEAEISKLRKQGICRGGENDYFDAMVWVRERSELMAPVAICPHCGKRPVEYMSVVFTSAGISLGTNYTACGHCKQYLEGLTPGEHSIYEIKWTVQKHFVATGRRGYSSGERQNVRNLLNWAFGMPRSLNPALAHAILNSASVSNAHLHSSESLV